MAATFDSIRIVTQDQSQELEIKDVPRAQRFENFKSRVAVELGRAEKRYVNPEDLDLFVFSEKMEDKERTLADYGIKEGAIVTRIDHFHGTSRRAQTNSTPKPGQADLPPYPGPPTGKALDNVFVKLDHRTINLHGLTTTSTVQELYDKLKKEAKVSQANTGLIFGSKELKPNLTLRDVAIDNNSTIFVFDKLIGGRC